MANGLLSFPQRQGYGLLSPYRTQDPFLQQLLDRARNPQADAGDEAMFAANPNGSQGLMEPVPQNTQPDLGGALASAQSVLSRPMPQTTPQQPQAPQRDRVSGWRVLDRVLGGQTITGGLDAERARLTAEAQRPQLMADQARIRKIVESLSPLEQLAYATNPEEFGKALSSNSEGYTLGAGGLRGGRGGIVASAPTFSTVNDSIYRNDPATSQSTVSAVAAPGFDDVTQRNKAEADAALGVRGLGIQQQNADASMLNAQTAAANSGFSLASGQKRFNPDGSEIAAVAPTSTAATNPATIELQSRVDSTRRDVLPTTQRMRSLVSSGDVITGLGANARLAAARALAATGNQQAQRQVAATQEYQNLSGALRVGIAKSLGANPSNADIILLEKITGGDIGQSPQALLATINQAEGRANSLITDVEGQIRNAKPAASNGGGQIAVNPQTGARVQWNGSAWVPI